MAVTGLCCLLAGLLVDEPILKAMQACGLSSGAFNFPRYNVHAENSHMLACTHTDIHKWTIGRAIEQGVGVVTQEI